MQRVLLGRLRLGLVFIGIALGFVAASGAYGLGVIGDVGAASSLLVSGAIVLAVWRRASVLSDRFDNGSADKNIRIFSGSLLFGVILIGYFVFTLRIG